MRWGKIDPSLDRNALVAEVNREDIWRHAAKSLGAAASDIPTSTSRGPETFFDGLTFNRTSRTLIWPPSASSGSREQAAMKARTLTFPAPVVPAKGTIAGVVPFPAPGIDHRINVVAILKSMATSVLPPAFMLTLIALAWQLLCSGPKSPLPPPKQIVSASWDLIFHPFYVGSGTDQGLGWHLLAGLRRVAMGYALAVVLGSHSAPLVGQSIWAMRGLDPIFQVLRTVPPLAWLPLSLAASRTAHRRPSSLSSLPRCGRSSSIPRLVSVTSCKTIATLRA